MNNVHFHTLLEKHYVQHAEWTSRTVVIVLANHQYNTRLVYNENFSHYHFPTNNMKAMVKLYEEVLKQEVHSHMFYSALHFEPWYR